MLINMNDSAANIKRRSLDFLTQAPYEAAPERRYSSHTFRYGYLVTT